MHYAIFGRTKGGRIPKISFSICMEVPSTFVWWVLVGGVESEYSDQLWPKPSQTIGLYSVQFSLHFVIVGNQFEFTVYNHGCRFRFVKNYQNE